MSTKVYIDDQLIDLSPDQVVAITKQVSSISSIQDVRGDFTNTFTAPFTQRNDKILGWVRVVDNRDKRPYRFLSAKITVGSSDILTNGVARIRQSAEGYQINLFSGIVGFFSTLGNTSIKSLDWSDFNHTWNTTTIGSRLISSEGYCYPLIDYGTVGDNPDGNLWAENLYPAVFVKEVISRIITQNGFTIRGKLIDNSDYAKLLVPFSNDNLNNDALTSAVEFTVNVNEFVLDATSAFQAVTFNLSTKNGDSIGSLQAGQYVFAQITEGKFRFNIRIENAEAPGSGANPVDVRIISSVKGDLIGDQASPPKFVPVYDEGTLPGETASRSIETEVFIFEAGEQISIQVRGLIVRLAEQSVFSFEAATDDIPFNSQIDFASTLPDISQADFFKAIMQIHSAVPLQSFRSNEIFVFRLDELLENQGLIDWSQKLDLSVRPVVDFNFGYSRTNRLTYAEDVTVTGDASLTVDDDTLRGTQTLIDLPFAASLRGEIYRGRELMRITQFTLNFETSTFEKNISVEPRIAYSENEPGMTFTIIGRDGTQAITNQAQVPWFSRPDKTPNLDFTNLIDAHFNVLQSMLDETKVVRASFNLTANDVEDFNFNVPVYISAFNSYFYVQRIEKFVPGRVTVVDLIRI